MQPVADRAPRRVLSVVCGFVFAALLALCANMLRAQPAVPVSQPLNGLDLELTRSDAQQAALLALLEAQRTPGSAEYRKWLTPEQFAQRFAPDTSARQTAADWLQQQGFEVTGVARSGMRVMFRGPAAQVQRAFGVALRAQVAGNAVAVSMTTGSRTVLPQALPVRGLRVPASEADATAVLASAVDANTQAVVVVSSAVEAADGSAWQELLAEAAAQGMTVLQTAGAARGNADASAMVAVPLAGQAIAPDAATLRPAWQSAPGLPLDGLRAAPDAVLADANTLFDAVDRYAAEHGRLGAIAPWIYRFADDRSIFSHADAGTPVGTWSAADGLGTVNAAQLVRAIAAAEAGTLVTLGASGTTVVHGQTLTLPVTVAANGGQPAGTVTVTLKGRNGNTVTLGPTAIAANGNGAYGATFSTSTLPGDVYDISAAFTSGASGTTASNTITTTVNPEDVTLTAAAPATLVGRTIPVTVTATSASGVGVPSGAVTVTAYTSATPTTYTGTLPSSSTSSSSTVVSVPATSSGKFTFQASCTSNGSFACNKPVSFAVAVTTATPTVTLTSTAQPVVANSATQKYDLSVTVGAPSGSTTAAPTGTVAIQNNGTQLATVTLNKGMGTYTASLGGASNSLVAAYGGDANYDPATSAAVVVSAPLVSTTTVLNASPTGLNLGATESLTASVTPAAYLAAGAPTGTITYRSSLQGAIGTATLGNGFVTYNLVALQVGTHSITASYSGDGNYAASTSSAAAVTVALGKVASITTLSVAPALPLAGQNTTLTATVTPNFPAAVAAVAPSVTCSGQVTFLSNNVFVGNGVLSGGTVSVTAKLPLGSDSLTAVYSGDTQCYGSTSTAFTVVPAHVASALTLQPSVGYANAGQTIQLTATVTGADAATIGVPTGTITFYDTRAGVQVMIGTAVLSARDTATGIAEINVSGSSAGQHSFSAVYSGDGVFLPSNAAAAIVFFGDFAVSFTPGSLTIPRGGSGSAIANLTVSSGFSAPVVLTCTPPGDSLISCVFQPSTVMAGGSAGLTVTTTAQSSKVVRASRAPLLSGAGATLAALLLVPFRRTRRLGAMVLLACCVVLASGGCSLSTVDSTNNLNGSGAGSGTGSTGTSSTGTPLGTQLLTITAVSADGTLRHTYTYPVTVQ